MKRMVVKSARALTDAEAKACARLSFRSNGEIYPWLKAIRDNKIEQKWYMPYEPSDARVILYRDSDLLLGWGIVLRNGQCGFYVRKSYRRQGIGTKLIERAKKLDPKLKLSVNKHDAVSTDFFESVGL